MSNLMKSTRKKCSVSIPPPSMELELTDEYPELLYRISTLLTEERSKFAIKLTNDINNIAKEYVKDKGGDVFFKYDIKDDYSVIVSTRDCEKHKIFGTVETNISE